VIVVIGKIDEINMTILKMLQSKRRGKVAVDSQRFAHQDMRHGH
jgi:hypothetical protein